MILKRIISVRFSFFFVHTWCRPSLVLISERVSLADHEIFVHDLVAVRLSRFPKPTEFTHHTSYRFCENIPLFFRRSVRVIFEKVLVWFKRWQNINVNMEHTIAVHQRSMTKERHTFPSWRHVIPSVFHDYRRNGS